MASFVETLHDLRLRPRLVGRSVGVLIAIAVFSITVYWFMFAYPATTGVFPSIGFLNTPKTGHRPVRQFVETERIALGEPLDEFVRDALPGEKLSKLSSALLDRFSAAGLPSRVPKCELDLSRYQSSGILSVKTDREDNDAPLSIALNLYNSEEIIPALSLALLEMIYHLQPNYRVYISIFENGSTDRTSEMLGQLASALLAAQVDGIIFRSSVLTRNTSKANRITALANIRNEALWPLLPYAENGTFLFINDVVTCGFDLLELVHQLHLQDAHVAMSTDWEVSDAFETPQAEFRDKWVARGINGEMSYPMKETSGSTWTAPNGDWTRDLWMTQDDAIYKRWLDGRPIPVYSGWNGAIALRAELFTAYHVRFRSTSAWKGGSVTGAMGEWGKLVATPGYRESDCAASECKLFARDIWNLLDGKARFVLASQSKTLYAMDSWERVPPGTVPPTVRRGEGGEEELIDWTNVTIPKTVVCAPIVQDAHGLLYEPFADGNIRQYLNPRFEGYKPGSISV